MDEGNGRRQLLYIGSYLDSNLKRIAKDIQPSPWHGPKTGDGGALNIAIRKACYIGVAWLDIYEAAGMNLAAQHAYECALLSHIEAGGELPGLELMPLDAQKNLRIARAKNRSKKAKSSSYKDVSSIHIEI